MSFNYVSFAVMLLIAVASVIGGWKINQKARKPGWAAVVPLYGSYVLAEITWGEGWMFLLDLLPGSSIIYKVMTAIKLMNSFGYTGGKKVLFILGCIFFHLSLSQSLDSMDPHMRELMIDLSIKPYWYAEL